MRRARPSRTTPAPIDGRLNAELRKVLARDDVQPTLGRFFNEAKAATRIHHPGIVDVYDFGYHASGHAYIVMEFLQGESLTALLKKGLQFGRVVDIAWQLASALGREFSYEVLKAISEREEPVLQQELKALVDADLVHRRRGVTTSGAIVVWSARTPLS